MESSAETNVKYSDDVRIIKLDDREFYIIGTAHISKKSADLVREVIENEKPDTVCVELDERRFKALSEQKKWENLDLKKLIKEKQLATLLINILLASYQKKMGEKLGVAPGVELLEAINVANENNHPISLCDRDIRITLKRAWNSMSFWQKTKFLFSGFGGVMDSEEISEEKLAEIKEKDALNELMKELGEAMPVLKRVLIDERDRYLAQKIKDSDGKKIVAVVGAGHVEGLCQTLTGDETVDFEEVEVIPPASPVTKIIGWGIPVIILASIAWIGIQKGSAAAGDNALFWVLANGIPSSLGSLIAMGHPLTVLATFVAAPLTSLTPVIGAGYVAAFVQAYMKPPLVKEFQTVAEDVRTLSKWWTNKLLRIILVFILSGLGSVLGTYVGAYEIITNLF